MPVLTRSRSKSKTATAVVSLPVPAVVGTAMSGFSGPGGVAPRPSVRVDVVGELGRPGGVQIRGLGRVDGGSAADGEESVEGAARRRGNRGPERRVGGFAAHVAEHVEVDAGGAERFDARPRPDTDGERRDRR